MGEIEAHDAVVRVEERRVRREVGRGARERLDVDTPLVRVEAVGLEGALLAEALHLVNVLVAAVVALAGIALRVLIGEAGADGLVDGRVGEVLRSDELQARHLRLP